MSTDPISFQTYQPQRDDQCPICLETEGEDWVFHAAPTSREDQKVNHIFHKKCIKEALVTTLSNPSCSLCRNPIRLDSLFEKEEVDGFAKARFEFLESRQKKDRSSLLADSLMHFNLSIPAFYGLNYFQPELFWTNIALYFCSGQLPMVLSSSLYLNPIERRINLALLSSVTLLVNHLLGTLEDPFSSSYPWFLISSFAIARFIPMIDYKVEVNNFRMEDQYTAIIESSHNVGIPSNKAYVALGLSLAYYFGRSYFDV